MGEVNKIAVMDGQSAMGPLLPGTGTLCIRPEAIGLDGALQLGRATVTDLAFFGTHIRAHASPVAAPDMDLILHLPPETTVAVGDVLDLSARAHVLLAT
jgi:spermidine/putrescine transport system ATP-binding protein